MGTKVQGIRLRGDKRNPEPDHVRIVFPGGAIDAEEQLGIQELDGG